MSVQILERHELDDATKQRLPEICSQCEHGADSYDCHDPLSLQHFVNEDPEGNEPISSIVRAKTDRPTACYSEDMLKMYAGGAPVFYDPLTRLPTFELPLWRLQLRIQNAASRNDVENLLNEYRLNTYGNDVNEEAQKILMQECFNILTSMFHPNADDVTGDKLLGIVHWMDAQEFYGGVDYNLYWSYGRFLIEMKEMYANRGNVNSITHLLFETMVNNSFNPDTTENVIPVVVHYLKYLPNSLEGDIMKKNMYMREIEIIFTGVTTKNISQLIEAGLIKQTIHAVKVFSTFVEFHPNFNYYDNLLGFLYTIDFCCGIFIKAIEWNAVFKHVLIGEGGREYVAALSTFIRNIDGGESEYTWAKELYNLLQ